MKILAKNSPFRHIFLATLLATTLTTETLNAQGKPVEQRRAELEQRLSSTLLGLANKTSPVIAGQDNADNFMRALDYSLKNGGRADYKSLDIEEISRLKYLFSVYLKDVGTRSKVLFEVVGNRAYYYDLGESAEDFLFNLLMQGPSLQKIQLLELLKRARSYQGQSFSFNYSWTPEAKAKWDLLLTTIRELGAEEFLHENNFANQKVLTWFMVPHLLTAKDRVNFVSSVSPDLVLFKTTSGEDTAIDINYDLPAVDFAETLLMYINESAKRGQYLEKLISNIEQSKQLSSPIVGLKDRVVNWDKKRAEWMPKFKGLEKLTPEQWVQTYKDGGQDPVQVNILTLAQIRRQVAKFVLTEQERYTLVIRNFPEILGKLSYQGKPEEFARSLFSALGRIPLQEGILKLLKALPESTTVSEQVRAEIRKIETANLVEFYGTIYELKEVLSDSRSLNETLTGVHRQKLVNALSKVLAKDNQALAKVELNTRNIWNLNFGRAYTGEKWALEIIEAFKDSPYNSAEGIYEFLKGLLSSELAMGHEKGNGVIVPDKSLEIYLQILDEPAQRG